jgi:hypothetical protein
MHLCFLHLGHRCVTGTWTVITDVPQEMPAEVTDIKSEARNPDAPAHKIRLRSSALPTLWETRRRKAVLKRTHSQTLPRSPGLQSLSPVFGCGSPGLRELPQSSGVGLHAQSPFWNVRAWIHWTSGLPGEGKPSTDRNGFYRNEENEGDRKREGGHLRAATVLPSLRWLL